MSLSQQLWQTNQNLAEACLTHPFVQGIADGSLAQPTFAYYVGQDAYFLDAFARAYSIAAAKVPDRDGFAALHALADGVLDELRLHQGYAAEWNVNLQTATPGAATRRYTDFLQATAWAQEVGTIMAAMTPCMRLYAFLGQQLARSGIPDHRYAPWISTYSSPEFDALTQNLETLLDRYGQRLPTLEAAYRYAMECEHDFFDAAWNITVSRGVNDMSSINRSSLTAAQPFHKRLLATAEPIWQTMLAHPFLSATADGSVPDDVFVAWLAQDYLFVRESTAFVGVLIGKAPPELRSPLIHALQVLNRELDLFREQAEAQGADLNNTVMTPTCHAYAQFLLATAYGRSFAEGFAALYGLEKAYLESWMQVKNQQQGSSRWQAFIDNWTSAPFAEYVSWLGTTLDQLAAGMPEHTLATLEDVFLLTARYEHRFWEMALTQERWPV